MLIQGQVLIFPMCKTCKLTSIQILDQELNLKSTQALKWKTMDICMHILLLNQYIHIGFVYLTLSWSHSNKLLGSYMCCTIIRLLKTSLKPN
jgi:hypothetical protein